MTWDSYPIGALVTVTAATEEPVTLAEAKLWCKVELDEMADDDLIAGLIATARGRYEEFTGRALLKQTFDQYLDRFPNYADGAVMPMRWPLVSVSSIRGFQTTDATDTGGIAMSTSDYYVDTAHEPGRVLPISTRTWPTATRTINAGIMRFIAGYSTSPTGVPEQAKERLKKMIAAGYEHRGDGNDQAVGLAMDAILRDDDLALPEWG